MVSVSLRQNPPEPVGRNASAAEPSIADLGLTERVDGYYDWAGRRLFLADRSPDPMTPGAYRHQAHPDLCDPAAPESDPASPRYEPPHLRHRPGDTWEVGGKPRDPDDPGPYGTAGWRPDPRTGRHRRGELPDPIPPWEQPEATHSAARQGSERPRAWRNRSRDDDEGSGGGLPTVPEQPPAQPRSRPSFWSEARAEEQVNAEAAPEEPYRFSKMREDAWDRFVVKSADLAAAHQVTALGLTCEYGRMTSWLIRVFRWIVAIIKGPSTNESSPTRGGTQLAPATSDAQAAHAQLAAHWREQPRQARPRPSPLPYMSRWEQTFDAQRGFNEAAVL
ncbi:hypothetical protein K3N28_10925 [Glycomyces sp. TRM65418]|uniref:hypothetical protein n=1 Tax=Glycomyces sp. TRM65418 TaxID=2867006 RepID=UPI001CE60E48|nr:hypothetical protein [Glycomyces sp. TRM65418]MCC3763585.1 hypothetical protein [Glycomyces sp. TRM65418]QZD57568.1 hypothetical protein K3N28_10865 [Glycomyces sp. TRM65418]